jgi:hypothetical protein
MTGRRTLAPGSKEIVSHERGLGFWLGGEGGGRAAVDGVKRRGLERVVWSSRHVLIQEAARNAREETGEEKERRNRTEPPAIESFLLS